MVYGDPMALMTFGFAVSPQETGTAWDVTIEDLSDADVEGE